MSSTPLPPEYVRLIDLIYSYGKQVASTGERAMSVELASLIASLPPYVPPEILHTGDYTAHFRHGFNTCRAEVLNRGPL